MVLGGRPIENDSWSNNNAAVNGHAAAPSNTASAGMPQGKNEVAQNQANAPSGNANAQNQNPQKSKKRTFEEYTKVDEKTIEEILSGLKQRVLEGETLNHFKKEINLLVE